MLKLNIVIGPRAPGYQVKALVSIVKDGVIIEEDQVQLKEMRSKLEQVIPGNLKVRYNMNMEQLILISRVKDVPEGQRIGVKLSEYVRSAAISLQITIK